MFNNGTKQGTFNLNPGSIIQSSQKQPVATPEQYSAGIPFNHCILELTEFQVEEKFPKNCMKPDTN